MNLVYYSNLDELHTSEAYFGKLMRKENTFIIPYINAGVSEHPLNQGREMKFINKCYVVFPSVQYFLVNNSQHIVDDNCNVPSLYLGGNDVLFRKIFDMEIKSQNGFLQLLPESLLTTTMWIPINTPNFRPNMDIKEAERFLKGENLPENLQRLLT